jgi:hypothetical protein
MPFPSGILRDQIESFASSTSILKLQCATLKSVDVLPRSASARPERPRSRFTSVRTISRSISTRRNSVGHIQISEGWIENGPEDFSGAFQDCEIGEFAVGDLVLAEAKRAQFVERLEEWRGNNAKIAIYFQTEGEIERFREIMAGSIEAVNFVEGTLARGFCFPAANLVVLSAAELFGRFAAHPRRRLRRAERNRAQIDFSELNEGDLVVHLEHGIGRFLGLDKFVVGQAPRLPTADGQARQAERMPLNRKGDHRKYWSSSLQTKRSSMFHSSRLTGFPLRLAQEKDRHLSAHSATEDGPGPKSRRRLPYLITPGKCLQSRRNGKRIRVTRSLPTPGGSQNLNIHFRFVKRRTK